MSKRGQNEGSIFKREDGRWVAVLDLGYEAGKRKRKYFYGETRREVQEQLTAALRAQQQGTLVTAERQTMEVFLTTWLEQHKKKIRPTTHMSYRNIVKLHLIPEIGRIQLAKLSPHEVQKMLDRKHEQGLAPRMVQYIQAVLRIALGRALKWGYVAQNVAKLVDAPSIERHESMFLSPEDARKLLKALEGERLKALFTVGLALGLRKGEALGLSWSDIDFEKRQLTVHMNLQFIDNQFRLVDTKTARSRRTIALPDVALQALLGHKAKQDEERALRGDLCGESGLVFNVNHG